MSKQKKKNVVKIPLVKTQNYYDACIQVIETNHSNVLDKEECMKALNKLRLESNYHGSLSTGTNKKNKINKIEKNQKTLDDILREETDIDIDIQDETEFNNEDEKSIDKPLDNDDKSENQKKMEDNNNNEKIKSNDMVKKIVGFHGIETNEGLKKFFKSKKKRYSVFKHINEYLESNNITLNEVIERNPFQATPYQIPQSYEFIEAVKFNNYDYVKRAVSSNYDYLFAIDYFGQTAYHWAAKLGDLQMLKLLIEFGKHHNQKDFKGRTPLYLAAVNDKMEICKYLLKSAGGNPHIADKDGKTAADVAASEALKSYIKDAMAQPFSNPVYKAKLAAVIKEREEKIKASKEPNKIK